MAQKVLIVEDELWIAEDIRDTLVEHDYTVMEIADNYEKALLSLRREQPDLVILDIRLSGEGTGIDVAKEINDRYQIPFLFISSNISPDTLPQVLEEMPNSILNKPCKPEDLIASVKLALARGALKKEEEPAEVVDDSFFVKTEHAYQKIVLDDLLFVKGEGSYTKVQLKTERLVLRATLKDFEFLDRKKGVMRVHRSYYVHLKYVDMVHSKYLTMGDYEIPLTKESKEELLNRIQKVR